MNPAVHEQLLYQLDQRRNVASWKDNDTEASQCLLNIHSYRGLLTTLRDSHTFTILLPAGHYAVHLTEDRWSGHVNQSHHISDTGCLWQPGPQLGRQELLAARARRNYKYTTCLFPKIKTENVTWHNERKRHCVRGCVNVCWYICLGVGVF